MAKLEGVKTLDMVNGEITKVAYGGAEYERVEGEGKVGDLVLIKHGWTYATKGEFYESVGQDSDKDVNIIGDDGEVNSNYRTTYELFRKVSATNPSVEDRVAKAEGEIEALKSDGAALKGEAEYKRISVDEAQDGDYVKFDEAPRGYLTAGKYYEIDYVDSNGDPRITDDDGDDFDTFCLDDDQFGVYRKASASEQKPERWKVGDYAKVVDATDYHEFNDGDIVELLEDSFTHENNEVARRITDEKIQYVLAKELVRATDEEVTEAKREAEFAKFKEGAKVRLKSGGGWIPLNGFENGKVYEVENVNFQRNHIRIIGGFIDAGFATPNQLEILSEAEAIEHKKWAEIGREVGEYKRGDVVQFRDDYVAIGVVEEVGDSLLGVRMPDEGYQAPFKNSVTLITPVEARFDC
ncbi:hypothetical protein [Bacillus atrophaeus]|uniref:hypothetical protein n=1 Tax=Bacillus atrophaeus TaxID=1452 RepID=UPI001C637C7C|nr:hypothetical protein [Bacillus atrophaeus]QYG88307.1 hypothetical protein HCU65_07365 [Bacillus atrophaeus]